MQRKSIGRFSAEQIERARQVPKTKVTTDMNEVMSTPEGQQKIQTSIERVIKKHARALEILKNR